MSNQLARKFYLAVHKNGAADASWQTEVAYGGGVGGCSTRCANDHVNVKQLSSDGSGRLFAAVKTANRNTGQAFVSLLVRNQSGFWSSYPFGAVEDLHTRPMVLLDEEHREVFMFAVLIRTITGGTTSTIDVSMNGVPIYSTATASLGTSGIRTLQIGNDKQLPLAPYADNIEAILP